ncbi:hypothetical protein CYMTET_3436, partial [Cymbomonas tetramitiformis]
MKTSLPTVKAENKKSPISAEARSAKETESACGNLKLLGRCHSSKEHHSPTKGESSARTGARSISAEPRHSNAKPHKLPVLLYPSPQLQKLENSNHELKRKLEELRGNADKLLELEQRVEGYRLEQAELRRTEGYRNVLLDNVQNTPNFSPVKSVERRIQRRLFEKERWSGQQRRKHAEDETYLMHKLFLLERNERRKHEREAQERQEREEALHRLKLTTWAQTVLLSCRVQQISDAVRDGCQLEGRTGEATLATSGCQLEGRA